MSKDTGVEEGDFKFLNWSLFPHHVWFNLLWPSSPWRGCSGGGLWGWGGARQRLPREPPGRLASAFPFSACEDDPGRPVLPSLPSWRFGWGAGWVWLGLLGNSCGHSLMGCWKGVSKPCCPFLYPVKFNTYLFPNQQTLDYIITWKIWAITVILWYSKSCSLVITWKEIRE